MQIQKFSMDAFISFQEKEMEEFLTFCEEVINNLVPQKDINYKLKSALHELLVNSLEHGYKKTGGNVSVSITKSDSFIEFEISDNGTGFDISSININKTVKELDLASSRGWGLAITSKMSNSFEINPNSPSGTKITVKFVL